MALVIKKPISLKDRLLASSKITEGIQKVEAAIEIVDAALEKTAPQEALPVIDQAVEAAEEPLFDMVAQQAYADILPKIDALNALSGEDLSKEMGILKKALIENPDACSIMLPTDIGKMVEALRRITGQALSEAVAKPKGVKKQKTLALTAEAMEAAFDEL